jgi:hypothetical protein
MEIDDAGRLNFKDVLFVVGFEEEFLSMIY